MVLITNRQSNILQNIETLHLFARVVSDICHSTDEREILRNSFELLSAFDEIVSLGYRENVNLAQNKEQEAEEELKEGLNNLKCKKKECSKEEVALRSEAVLVSLLIDRLLIPNHKCKHPLKRVYVLLSPTPSPSKAKVGFDDVSEKTSVKCTSIPKPPLKEIFSIALKNPGKGFPVNRPLGVLRWRLITKDETLVPYQ
ncbi:20301_t:CDS:2, partial [Cetraspora pellucida]